MSDSIFGPLVIVPGGDIQTVTIADALKAKDESRPDRLLHKRYNAARYAKNREDFALKALERYYARKK